MQIAKAVGCHVIGTCSTAEKAQLLCALGCDTIVNHRTRDVGEVCVRVCVCVCVCLCVCVCVCVSEFLCVCYMYIY